MLILATLTYPATSVMAMGKAAVESLKREVPHVNRLSVQVTYGGDGLKAYNLYELEKGYEDEASRTLFENFVPFYNIDGFKLNLEMVLPVAEALPMIRLSL